MVSANYAECRKKAPYADCHYAECRYAECRYAECCGANHLIIDIRAVFKRLHFPRNIRMG